MTAYCVEMFLKIANSSPLLLLGTALCVFALCSTVPAAQEPGKPCPPQASPPSEQSSPSPSNPTLQPGAEQVIACIGSQSITGATFTHWLAVARRDERHLSTSQVVTQVMGFLISGDWVIEESARLHIHVSEAEVRRKFNRIRKQQFPKRKEFEAFLKHSGETVADLMFRTRLDMLSTQIQRRVGGNGPSKSAARRALERFVHDFRARWTAQTYCEPAYAIPDCGHVQTPL